MTELVSISITRRASWKNVKKKLALALKNVSSWATFRSLRHECFNRAVDSFDNRQPAARKLPMIKSRKNKMLIVINTKSSNFSSKYSGKMRLTSKLLFIGVTALGMILGSSPLLATNTASQTVTFSVSAINELSVSGNPGALTVSTATAGSAPDSVSDATTTYSITTNESTRKITAAINSNMPAGTTLTANLAAPTGGSSAGALSLSTVAVDAVTGITTLNESGKTITYSLSATSAAGTVSSTTRTVTLTVIAGI